MTRSRLVVLSVALPAVLAAASAARAADGEAIFKKSCMVCHTVEAGKNKIGPSLAGIVGRKSGSVEGFNYTEANKNSGATWDEATLETYLQDPKKFMTGTKMVFPGLKDADARAALIAYLKQH